jgi:hypothetical protein
VNNNQPTVGASPAFDGNFIHTCGVEGQLEAWKQYALKG